jgi:hypothetical protein
VHSGDLEEYKLKMRVIKKTLKAWEYEFAKEKGRKPTKEDIALDLAIGIHSS